MAKKDKRILGINPGTRYLGLAVLHGSELMDWRIKTFKGKWTKEKAGRILEIIKKQIEIYDINALAIKKFHHSRTSANLVRLINKVKNFARSKKLKTYQYSIKKIEIIYIENRKQNKRNLIEAMVIRYPILHHDLDKEKSLKNSYYFRMFEAIALASAATQGIL